MNSPDDLNGTAAAPAVVDDVAIEAVVRQLFDDEINPRLESHGGSAKVLRVEGGRVFVELHGGCRGCPGARATMRYGIEAMIREVAPSVVEVIDATDHG
jgi:Fe-S cluster biogenesis protein NfuA